MSEPRLVVVKYSQECPCWQPVHVKSLLDESHMAYRECGLPNVSWQHQDYNLPLYTNFFDILLRLKCSQQDISGGPLPLLCPVGRVLTVDVENHILNKVVSPKLKRLLRSSNLARLYSCLL
ncbi:type 11 methyltransferase [Anopheles sinensis]|uniref:Type 11 methyltransferase n=1 Tax=Anopheles sinensis TaxID=74873 RepID=A0A084W2E5_ANOSI|nr:type 11 methyltransferase [Anopheles sinensis]